VETSELDQDNEAESAQLPAPSSDKELGETESTDKP